MPVTKQANANGDAVVDGPDGKREVPMEDYDIVEDYDVADDIS